MKNLLFQFLKAFSLLLLVLALYRFLQKMQQPEMLFKVIHGSFLLTLFLWVLWAAKNMLSKQAAALRNQWQTEARALLYVTFLVLIGFLFCAESFALQDKRAIQVVPWVKTEEHFAQALAASGLFSLLSWGAFLFSRKVAPDHDPWLIPLSFLTCGIGLVFLYRLTPDILALRGENDFRNLFRHQAMSFLLSLLVFMIALHYFTSRRIERLTRKRYLYVFLSVALISFTAVFGTDLYGRKLAVNLGGLISFQTVELVKMLALMFMVGYFRFEMPFLEVGKGFFSIPRARYVFPYLTMWGLTILPIFLQKDIGPTVLIFTLFLVVFYLGTGSAFSVLLGLAAMVGLGAASYWLGWPTIVKTRVDMWLEPFRYSHHVSESLWAIGSGGVFGVGTGKGMAHFIPVVHSDFNFAMICEEWGFLGISCLLAAFSLLVWRTFEIARKAPATYEQLLVAGIGSLWAVQTFVIVGGNMGLLPLTGITLPFISFGGSSLLVNCLALAIVVRISSGNRPFKTA